MPRKGHSEQQIIAALKQYESGDKVADIWRKLGERGHVLHVEKAVYGTGVQELRELRQLREENGRLKRLVADLSLDRQILEDRLQKAIKPRQRCRLARWAQEAYQIGARRSARLLQVPSTTLIYKSRKNPQEPLRRPALASSSLRLGSDGRRTSGRFALPSCAP